LTRYGSPVAFTKASLPEIKSSKTDLEIALAGKLQGAPSIRSYDPGQKIAKSAGRYRNLREL
jgi:hypothetical protein